MRRREQKQSYQLESLEVRTMLTGNVNASMISGDSRNNAFRVRPSSSGAEIVVEGFEGTSINGRATARFDMRNLRDDIRVSTGGGNNKFSIGELEVPDDVIVRGGSGRDFAAVVTLVGGDVSMSLGGGADTAAVVGDVAGNAKINTGGGNDKVLAGLGFLPLITGGDLNISTGSGRDEVTVQGVEVGDDFTLRTGGGNDMAFIDASGINDRMNANLGGGSDELWIRNSSSGGRMQMSGGGGTDGFHQSGFAFGSTTTVASFEFDSVIASADRDALRDSIFADFEF